ncbi:MAG: TonB-dependent receptor plug domain-containing protein [Candidatus Kapaibacterium sp.]
MIRLIILLAFLGISDLYAKKIDTITTEQVVVTGQRIPYLHKDAGRKVEIIDAGELKYSPDRSINDIFEMSAGVDLRERGAPGMQADISIRGGNSNQVAVMIDGIPVNDPQTGHHNLNLPLDYNSIGRVEILSGPGARTIGTGAFSGAVNILTKEFANQRIGFEIKGGQNDYFSLSGNSSFESFGINNLLALSYESAGPYTKNTEYGMGNFLYKGSYDNEQAGKFGLMLAGAFRNFGANSFYTALFPDQYEETRTMLAALTYSSQTQNPLEIKAYWRYNQDHFELFRYDSPDWYDSHNNHRTNVYGAAANYSLIWGQGISSFGVDAKTERLLSNMLGMPMSGSIAVPGYDGAFYTHKDSRENASFFLEHTFFSDVADVSAGVMLNWFSTAGWETTGGIDLAVRILDDLHAMASINNGLRLPTFTEMYYTDPTNQGNPDLVPERSVTFEGGFKYANDYYQFMALAFIRQGRNIIDWVRSEDSLVWRAMNITELNTSGIDLSARSAKMEIFGSKDLALRYFRVGLMWIFSEKSSDKLESYYAMDYLRLKISGGFAIGYKGAALAFEGRYEERAGKYYDFESERDVAYEPYFIADIKISQEIFGSELFMTISNIFDKKYYDLAHVPLPGRWIRAGIRGNIRL